MLFLKILKCTPFTVLVAHGMFVGFTIGQTIAFALGAVTARAYADMLQITVPCIVTITGGMLLNYRLSR